MATPRSTGCGPPKAHARVWPQMSNGPVEEWVTEEAHDDAYECRKRHWNKPKSKAQKLDKSRQYALRRGRYHFKSSSWRRREKQQGRRGVRRALRAGARTAAKERDDQGIDDGTAAAAQVPRREMCPGRGMPWRCYLLAAKRHLVVAEAARKFRVPVKVACRVLFV